MNFASFQAENASGTTQPGWKRCGKIIDALCITAMLTGSALAQTAAKDDPFIATIESMKHSISPIMCLRTDADRQNFTPIVVGTGFFVTAQGDFMTASHVVKEFVSGQPPIGNCLMFIWLAAIGNSATGRFNAEFLSVVAKECITDQSADIALCHADLSGLKDISPVPVRFDFSKRADGTAIAMTGFPLFNSLPITSRGYIGAYSLQPGGPTQMVLDRAAWPGGSGSPVYDQRGQVLGMLIIAGEGTASGISYARTSFAIQQFLAAHPFETKQ